MTPSSISAKIRAKKKQMTEEEPGSPVAEAPEAEPAPEQEEAAPEAEAEAPTLDDDAKKKKHEKIRALFSKLGK